MLISEKVTITKTFLLLWTLIAGMLGRVRIPIIMNVAVFWPVL